MKLQLKGITGAIISVEEYFDNEVKSFIENFDGENENAVENFKGWIDGDSDFIAVNDNGDEIEEMTEEQDEYYNGCFNAAIAEIKKYFGV